mgnify:CR=1 FL=1
MSNFQKYMQGFTVNANLLVFAYLPNILWWVRLKYFTVDIITQQNSSHLSSWDIQANIWKWMRILNNHDKWMIMWCDDVMWWMIMWCDVMWYDVMWCNIYNLYRILHLHVFVCVLHVLYYILTTLYFLTCSFLYPVHALPGLWLSNGASKA